MTHYQLPQSPTSTNSTSKWTRLNPLPQSRPHGLRAQFEAFPDVVSPSSIVVRVPAIPPAKLRYGRERGRSRAVPAEQRTRRTEETSTCLASASLPACVSAGCRFRWGARLLLVEGGGRGDGNWEVPVVFGSRKREGDAIAWFY
ncbi:unnamed protein product [Linum trigynum]|uniref:Uncharacterized protein n=1 Tax=Linum trigynum TaxID=586398 RepID=A0AAV2CJ10_9ROSI